MSAVVLITGGVKSAVALSWARTCKGDLHALTVAQGEDHPVGDLVAARAIAVAAGCVSHDIVRVATFEHGWHTPTTPPDQYRPPAFELALLGLALTRAATVGATTIVWGRRSQECGCGDSDMEQVVVELASFVWPPGLDLPQLCTPLAYDTLAGVARMAHALSGCLDMLRATRTCVTGEAANPCLVGCVPCAERARMFAAAGLVDPGAQS